MGDFAVFGIVEIRGKIPLVQERGNFPKKMRKLPGGRPITTEEKDPYLVLIREISDEIGVNIVPSQDSDLLLRIEKQGRNGNYELFFYKTKYYGGEPTPRKEIEKCELFAPSDIIKMIEVGEILPDHAEALRAHFNKAASSV